MMNKAVSTNESHDTNNAWDVAILACLKQIGEYEARAARLRTSLEYFETRKKSGDPFPGAEKLQEGGLLSST
jgi:hypothetical protein